MGATKGFRIRRSVDDKQTDFYYNENGVLDIIAIKDFVGRGEGYISTLYDQTKRPWYVRLLNWIKRKLI